MKKVLSLILAFVFAVGICASAPMTIEASAASVDDLTFELNEDCKSYSVVDCNENASGEIVIPGEYNGLPVTGISGVYEVSDDPEDIPVGEGAFYNCVNISSIVIPDSVSYINYEAFEGCSGLEVVTVPESIDEINPSIFSDCFKLSEMKVSQSNQRYSVVDGVLFNSEKTELVLYPKGKSNESYRIPDSVTSIGYSAFIYCKSLVNITIPDSVISIGDNAFYCCSSLTSVTIPDSVTSIGDGAFYGTVLYKNINNWDNNVLYIGNHLIVANIEISGDYIIKPGTKTIAEDAFHSSKNLESVVIPDSVTSIGDRVFYYCSSLTSVTIPDSVTSIGVGAFSDCSSLTSVTIPGSVKIIGESAFEDCYLLQSIIICDGVSIIQDDAFLGAYNLNEIVVPESVTSIGEHALGYKFEYDEYGEVEVKDSQFKIYGVKNSAAENYAISNGFDFKEVDFDNLDSFFTFEDYVSGESYMLTGGAKSFFVGDLTIPSEYNGKPVTSIGESAFSYCTGLTSVTIPDSVTSIGDYAFDGCENLSSVIIPNSIEDIGDSAFYWTDLDSITIPGSVDYIGSHAFEESGLTTLKIEDGVSYIGDRAFYDCPGIVSVTIPESVNYIGDEVFGYYCYLDENYEEVYAKVSELEISGVKGSEAEYYATENGFTFIEHIHDFENNYCKECKGKLWEHEIFDEKLTMLEIYDYNGYDKNVVIPESIDGYKVVSLGSSTFAHNEMVETVMLPKTIKEVGDFSGESIKSIYVAEDNAYFKSVDGMLFTKDMSSLLQCPKGRSEAVVIPEGVQSIASDAFGNCRSLNSITIPDTVTSIGESAFYGTALYNDSSKWDNGVLYINNHLIDVKNSLSGEYTIKNGTKCIANVAFGYSGVTSVTIPDGVTSIGIGAFEWCGSLTNVTIPESVTSIGARAFSDCPLLVNVVLPECLTSIEYATFKNCSSLTNIVIPNGVTEIGEWAFVNCSSITDITIPDGTTIIDNEAFYGTSLKSITIPSSVTEIGYFAFGYRWISESYEAEKVEGFTIYGEKGTAAETYANENGFTFIEKVTHTHNHTSTVTKQPTCTESGTKTFTCSCGDSYTETIPATGHKDVTITGKAATCTATGLTDGKKCSVCGTVTKAQETIKAKGHTTSVINKKDATCTADGYTGDTYCSVCKTTTAKGSVIKTVGHKWNSGSVTTEPTCTTQGEKTYVCTVCYDAKSELISAKGHKEVVIPAVAPTYKEPGKTEGKKCSVCGTITVAQKDVAKLTLATPVVTVKNSATGVKVAWKAIDGAESYKVYRKTYSTKTKKYGSWKTCGTATKTSYVDVTAKSGTKYIYTVKAFNGDTKSGIKNSSSILFLAQPTVKIANNASGVKVSWNKITGATGYKVYRAEYKNGKWTGWKSVKTITKGSTVSWTDTKAKSGVKYKYTVKAVNGKTASTYKSSSSLLYLAQPKTTVKAVSNGVKVSWTQITGAASYKIYRSEYNTKTKKWSSWKGIKTAKSTSKSYTDKSAKKGVKYRYTVKAVNGKVASSYKASSSVKR